MGEVVKEWEIVIESERGVNDYEERMRVKGKHEKQEEKIFPNHFNRCMT